MEKITRAKKCQSFKPNVTKLYFECNLRQIWHGQNLPKKRTNPSPSSSLKPTDLNSNPGKLKSTSNIKQFNTNHQRTKQEQKLHSWRGTNFICCLSEKLQLRDIFRCFAPQVQISSETIFMLISYSTDSRRGWIFGDLGLCDLEFSSVQVFTQTFCCFIPEKTRGKDHPTSRRSWWWCSAAVSLNSLFFFRNIVFVRFCVWDTTYEAFFKRLDSKETQWD